MECTCNLIEEIAGTKQEQTGVRVQGDCVGRSPRSGAAVFAQRKSIRITGSTADQHPQVLAVTDVGTGRKGGQALPNEDSGPDSLRTRKSPPSKV